jgi:DNA-binding NarL/FixJ family response regulator
MTERTRVLIADDALYIRAIVRAVLNESSGYVVVAEAGNGKQAVEESAVSQPDVVLLDLSMPVMDGLEALPLIRAAAPDASVIVLSGLAESIAGAAARDGGAIGYIEKDDLVTTLVPALNSILRQSDRRPA